MITAHSGLVLDENHIKQKARIGGRNGRRAANAVSLHVFWQPSDQNIKQILITREDSKEYYEAIREDMMPKEAGKNTTLETRQAVDPYFSGFCDAYNS